MINELPKALKHQTSMMVVGVFKVLTLWIFDSADTDLAVIGPEDGLKAFHEAPEVFTVELCGEDPAIGGDE